ncbi:putative bifunctional diguanylate cyclase/phosphodiesterase [Acuticoccus sp.]|uniref:putative bifunctional diguanylate cyclase/phosphodiesterase n=1 Tax=Acuticoccus sp. TaxID=1904378 RepID=UPI003B520B78
MLNDFNAALAKLGRTQPFDHLAAMAQLALDCGPVAIVDAAPEPVVIGYSSDAARMPEHVMRLAASVAPIDPQILHGISLPLAGTPLPFDAPFDRVVNLRMVGAGRKVLCMTFPQPQGLCPERVHRFVEVGRRQVAEHVMTQRYRADLKRYITMFDNMERTAKVGLWDHDLVNGKVFWSDEIYRIYERPMDRLPTARTALDNFTEPGRTRLRNMLLETRLTGAPCDVTLPFLTETGRKRTGRLIASLQRSSDGSERLSGVFQDVTAAQEANERLWWAANHDALTGLPNRALFADRFSKALERRKRTGKMVCLVLVDVDRFKAVNDTLGHSAGDKLLTMVAQRLQENVRSHDTVARTGGDEFSVLMEDIGCAQALDGVLERLRSALDVRLVWEERTMLVTLSAGAAVAPEHGVTEHELIHSADLALYRMKDQPRGALALYDPALGRARKERSQLLVAARGALEAGRIVPYYQPQIDIASGRIVGVEALARWVAEDRVLTASEFSFALMDEEIGTKIGLAVVDRAIAEVAELNARRVNKVALAINASSGELIRNSFLQRLGAICQRHGPDAGPITVEINEQVVLDDVAGTLSERMSQANESGVKFSLDDFGSSYASLIHISSLPISELKVDRRFVTGLEDDPSKQKIIRGIIDVARSLDLRLIVEGVETAEQVRRITELGGRFAQGFYYSRAVPIEDLRDLLDAEAARDAPRQRLATRF